MKQCDAIFEIVQSYLVELGVKPRPDQSWSEILTKGKRIDKTLKVRLEEAIKDGRCPYEGQKSDEAIRRYCSFILSQRLRNDPRMQKRIARTDSVILEEILAIHAETKRPELPPTIVETLDHFLRILLDDAIESRKIS